MHYNQSWAAKGIRASAKDATEGSTGGAGRRSHGGRERQLHTRSMERAAVNIYRTENSYEILVFAPGRIKEHFQLGISGNELTVSYHPPEGFPRPEWVLREYSRGGFVRTFALDESVDPAGIQAKYENGVLQISLPLVPGKERKLQEIPIN